MHTFLERHVSLILVVAVLCIATLAGVTVYQKKTLTDLQSVYATTLTKLHETEGMLVSKELELNAREQVIAERVHDLALSEENAAELLARLTDEKNRNEDFENQIDNITGTVGKLDKLSKTDPALLMKYSKVYFLNEHYAPENITEIDSEFVAHEGKSEYINSKVDPFLTRLLKDAQDDDISLKIVSAYRSFDEQKSLKSTYTVYYGSGANTFSADQGYSEHQLGTTVDFTTDGVSGALTGFENSGAYEWLIKNAYKYGFVLSYPKDNAYYVFEPWHWRFVGEDLAKYLHKKNQYFYDLDQRTINEYLISIFD